MHHTISYPLAQGGTADLRQRAQLDNLARAARRAQPGQRRPAWSALERRVRRRAAAGKALERAPKNLVA